MVESILIYLCGIFLVFSFINEMFEAVSAVNRKSVDRKLGCIFFQLGFQGFNHHFRVMCR